MSNINNTIKLNSENTQVLIVDGQISSFKFGDDELFHTAGLSLDDIAPQDWKLSELNMFPIVGPTDSNYLVHNGEFKFPLDQHGISRVIPFYFESGNPSSAHFIQNYKGEIIENPKKNREGHPEYISWLPFKLSKSIKLSNGLMEVNFNIENTGAETMNYQFGWHPAFKINGDIDSGKLIDNNNQEYRLTDLLENGAPKTMKLSNVDTMSYQNSNIGFEMKSSGFGNYMIWCPNNNASMFCVEPVTSFPASETERDYFKNPSQGLVLKPGESRNFSVTIKNINY
ncbi:hypothetical protein ACFLTH_13460 [Bacteroidota bacterium]